MNGLPTNIYLQPKSAAILPPATAPSQSRSPRKTKFALKAYQTTAILPPSTTSKLSFRRYVRQRAGLFNRTRTQKLRDQQLCSDVDLVRVSQLVLVGFKNFHVFVRVSIELLADF